MIRKLPFASKLIITVVVAIFIPILIAITWLYNLWDNAFKQMNFDHLQNISNITISKLEESIEYVEDTAQYVAANDNIKNLLLDESIVSSQQELYDNYLEMTSILSTYVTLKDEIVAVIVRSNKGYFYSSAKEWTRFEDSRFPKYLYQEEGNWHVQGNTVYYSEFIRVREGEKILGELVIAVDTSVFYDLVKSIDYSNSGEVYLINDKNQIITSKEEKSSGSVLKDEYAKLMKNDNKIEHIWFGEDEALTVFSSAKSINGWRLLLAIPEARYLEESLHFRRLMSIFLITIGVLGIITIVTVSTTLTKPIKLLSKKMKKIGEGEWDTTIYIPEGDEIAELNHSFDKMLEDMKRLMQSEYQQHLRTQSAEMRSLQMQINPHFLYNTLDTINWLARAGGNEDVGEITVALSKLMRYSLSDIAFVKIKDEVANLKAYMEIQDVRYGDRLTVYFEVEEDLAELYIPKLLIQPILENAIVHGVEEKVEDSKIHVRIKELNGDIYIEVEDDGVGMTFDVIERILMRKDEEIDHKSSIGMHNVKKRIQLLFGEEYGMQIKSVLGGGTKITLHMKKLEEPTQTRIDTTR